MSATVMRGRSTLGIQFKARRFDKLGGRVCVPFMGSSNYKQMHSPSRWREIDKQYLTLAHRLLGLGTE